MKILVQLWGPNSEGFPEAWPRTCLEVDDDADAGGRLEFATVADYEAYREPMRATVRAMLDARPREPEPKTAAEELAELRTRVAALEGRP